MLWCVESEHHGAMEDLEEHPQLVSRLVAAGAYIGTALSLWLPFHGIPSLISL